MTRRKIRNELLRSCLFLTGALFCILLVSCTQPQKSKSGSHLVSVTETTNDTTAIIKMLGRADSLFTSQPDSSMDLAKTALAESKKIGFKSGIGESYVIKGIANEIIGKLDSAKNDFNKALSYSIWDSLNLAKIHRKLGSVYQLEGDYEKAMFYFKKIMDQPDRDDSSFLAVKNQAYYDFSNVLFSLGRYNESLHYLQELALRVKQDSDQWLLANCYNNIMTIYDKLGNDSLFDVYAQKSVDVCIRNQFNDLLVMVYANLSENYAIRQNAEKAFYYLNKVKELQENLFFHRGMVYYGTAGSVYLDLARYKDAISPLKQALRIALKHQAYDIALNIRHNLAKAYAHTGNYKNATEQYQTYVTLNDSFKNLQIKEKISRYEVKFRTAEKDKALLQKQLALSKQDAVIQQKNTWIISIIAGAFALLLFLFILYRNILHRHKSQQKDMEILRQQNHIGKLQSFIDGENKERERIGRELHDGISCMLTAINMNLGAIQQRNKNVKAMAELDEVMKMLQNTGVELRRTAHDLMPDALHNHSLPESLENFIKGINNNSINFETELSCYGDFCSLNKSLATIIYRMIQELMHNIIKHAAATFATLQIRSGDNKISIAVEDNGRGFNPQAAKSGIGLAQIATRIKTMNGYLSIDAHKGRGTIIYIEFDVEQATKIIADENKKLYN